MQLPARKRADTTDDCSGSVASGRHRGRIDGIKVFSAYRHEERNQLGRVIGQWLDENDDVDVVETIVTQSSGSGFHCVTITLLCSVAGCADQREKRIAESSASPVFPDRPDRPDRDSIRFAIQSVIDRLEGVNRDVGTALSRISSSAAARDAVGEMNVERLQDAATVLAAALEDLSHA